MIPNLQKTKPVQKSSQVAEKQKKYFYLPDPGTAPPLRRPHPRAHPGLTPASSLPAPRADPGNATRTKAPTPG